MAGFKGLLDFTGLPVGSPSGGTAISAVVVETLTASTAATEIHGTLIEVLTAADLTSTHIHGALLEVLVAPSATPLGIAGALLEVLIGRLHPTEDEDVPLYPDIAEKRFGRDLVLTYPDREVTPTPSGDWPTVAGRPNLHAAMRRRLVTTPGQLVHRSDYGGGLETFVGELNAPAQRSRLAAGARSNVLRDRRIEEAVVSVAAPEEDQVIVQLGIRPAGEVEAESVSILTEA